MTDPLVMYVEPVSETRTANKALKWVARCWTSDGREFSAASRNGAPFALARALVEAQVADQEVVVITEPLVDEAGRVLIAGAEVRYQSLTWMATRTITESATQPVRSARWREPDFGFARNLDAGGGRFAKKGGGTPSAAAECHPGPESDKNPVSDDTPTAPLLRRPVA